MNKQLIILAITICCITAFNLKAVNREEFNVPGGWSEWEQVPVAGYQNDSHYNHVKPTVQKGLEQKGLHLVYLQSYQIQVVNGVNVRVRFFYAPKGQNDLRLGEAVVYYLPYNQNQEPQLKELNLLEEPQRLSEQLDGGWSEWKDAGIDYDFLINSPQHLAAVAVRKELKEQHLRFLGIKIYQTQVVSGLNVRVRFDFEPESQTNGQNVREGNAIVYYQPWNLANAEPRVTQLDLPQDEKLTLDGGWSEWKDAGIDYDYLIDSPQHLAAVAVRKALKQQNLRFIVIKQYQTQVVSGLNVRVKFDFQPESQTNGQNVREGSAIVYYQPWNLANAEPRVTQLDLPQDEKQTLQEQVRGGWSEWKDFGVDYIFGIDSPERISDITVRKALQQKGLNLIRMVRFQIQVVNGYNVRSEFTYHTGNGKDFRQGSAVVYFQPWNVFNAEPQLQELNLQQNLGDVEEEVIRKENAHITGGWSDWQNFGVDYMFGIDSPERISDITVRKALQQKGLNLIRMVRFQIQVVNGYNVRSEFTYHTGNGKDFRQGSAIVYFQPWNLANAEPQLVELNLQQNLGDVEEEVIRKENAHITGGWSDWQDFGVDYMFGIDSPERISDITVRKALQQKGLNLIRMVRFQIQVVNGYNVRSEFTYHTGNGKDFRQGQAVVYFQPWNLANAEPQLVELNLQQNLGDVEEEVIRKENAHITGGWSDWQDFGVDYMFGIDSPERISDITVRKALQQKGLNLIRMVRFQIQVVNGYNVRSEFTYHTGNGKDFRQGQAVVYFQPWNLANAEPQLVELNLDSQQTLQEQLDGGWSEWQDFGVDYLFAAGSPESTAHVTVSKALKQRNLQLNRMVKFQTQVVNGLNIRAQFSYRHQDQNDEHQGEAVIYYQPWNIANSKPKLVELKLEDADNQQLLQEQVRGGWSEWQDFGVDYLFGINSPESVADRTVRKALEQRGLQLIRMVKFQTQVVSGIKVRATFTYNQKNRKDYHQGQVVVSFQPWNIANSEPQLEELTLDDQQVPLEQVHIAGGWSDWQDFGIDYMFGVGSPESIADIAVRKALKEKNLNLVQMLRFQTQVVNGLNVRSTFTYQQQGQNDLSQGEAVVYYQPWNLANSEPRVVSLDL